MTEIQDLHVRSGSGASGQASQWARTWGERVGLSEQRMDALDLCVVELVSNVVNHGYRGAAGNILVQVEMRGNAVVLTITDSAPAFDPLSVPTPKVAASLEETQIGGWGVHLVRTSASDCKYERRGDQNVFTARFD